MRHEQICLLTQVWNWWYTKVRIPPKANLVSHWVLIGVTSRNLVKGLLTKPGITLKEPEHEKPITALLTEAANLRPTVKRVGSLTYWRVCLPRQPDFCSIFRTYCLYNLRGERPSLQSGQFLALPEFSALLTSWVLRSLPLRGNYYLAPGNSLQGWRTQILWVFLGICPLNRLFLLAAGQ